MQLLCKDGSGAINVCLLTFDVLFTIFNQPVFLASLLLTIALLSSEILLPSSHSFLFFPYVHFAHLHPHVVEGLLFVSVTTLVLFFASGMYQEKIEYANQ
jgi:integral membrane sensor domain MASE1